MQKISSQTFTPVTPENPDLYLGYDTFSETSDFYFGLFTSYYFFYDQDKKLSSTIYNFSTMYIYFGDARRKDA